MLMLMLFIIDIYERRLRCCCRVMPFLSPCCRQIFFAAFRCQMPFRRLLTDAGLFSCRCRFFFMLLRRFFAHTLFFDAFSFDA